MYIWLVSSSHSEFIIKCHSNYIILGNISIVHIIFGICVVLPYIHVLYMYIELNSFTNNPSKAAWSHTVVYIFNCKAKS